MNRTFFNVICLLLTAILLSSCNVPSDRKGDTAGGKIGTRPAGLDLTDVDPYSSGMVFATLDGNAVTLEEFERFVLRTTGKASKGKGPHGGSQSRQDLIPYMRYDAGVREAAKRGLQSDPYFINTFEIAYRFVLAKPFKEWLEKNVEIPLEAIEGLIPEKWIEANFLLKIYPVREAAQDAMDLFSDKGGFFSSENGKGNVKNLETGLMFPGSGFFEEWDEHDLYRLDERGIYGPVRTGVGWALVGVKEKKIFSEEDKERFMTSGREKLSSKFAAEAMADFAGNLQVEPDDEALARAINREFMGMGFSDLPVVTIESDGSKAEVSYRLFRLFNPVNYANLNRRKPREQWLVQVKQDLRSLENQYFVGQMAFGYREKGHWTGPLSPMAKKILYDYRKVLLYSALNHQVADQVKADISPKELEEYYRSNSRKFYLPAQAEVVYLFTVDADVAEKWKSAVMDGKSFREAAELVPVTRSPHSDPRESEFKRATISRGDKQYESIQDGIFSLGQGETGVFEGDMGHYLVKVLTRKNKRTPPLDEVSAQVLDFLSQEKTAGALSGLIDDLVKEVDLQVVESFRPKFQPPAELNRTPEIPEKDIPFPDRG